MPNIEVDAVPIFLEIDRLINAQSADIKASSDVGSRYASQFCEAILHFVSTDTPNEVIDPIGMVFSSTLPKKVKRIAAICFVRLLACKGREKIKDQGFWYKVYMLFDEELLHDVYPTLKIDPRAQTFEKENKLIQCIEQIDEDLVGIMNSLSTLQVLSTFRQKLLQKLNYTLVKVFLRPFLLFDRPDVRMQEILGTVEEYLEARGIHALYMYEQALGLLNDFAAECVRLETHDCKYFLGCAGKLTELVERHFSESSFSKTANISVVAADKKYPLSNVGGVFSVGLIVRNNGLGHGYDTSLEIDAVVDLRLKRMQIFLGHLEPGSQLVELPAEVIITCSYSLIAGKIKWMNFDKTLDEYEFTLELKSQRSDVPWEGLKLKDPYELEAVANEDELVGRKDILGQLYAQTQGKAITSSLIFGQKRVGKTSIVKTLCNRISSVVSSVVQVIYLEGGDYINPNPLTTLANLGRLLCEEIRSTDIRFQTIQVPQFDNAIAPLSGFLNMVSRIAPEFRVLFILDEFDELPMDLYRRGAVGDAFFLTIRSISNKSAYGFILVGSEKMEFVLNYQGERLNKFENRRIDYFDKETHWSDFSDLVRRPVIDCLEFTDDSLLTLYAQSAGNPFFTKQICRELFRMMVDRRDCHVTQKEVHEATAQALATVAANSFQHFWDDGIFETGERKEEKSLLRRKVLLAFGEMLRSGVAEANQKTMKSYAESYGLDSLQLAEELREFERRQVLENVCGTYRCKVPYFQKWLAERGVSSIVTDIIDPDVTLERRKREEDARVRPEEIVTLVEKWGFYKGRRCTEDQVRGWLNQWGTDLFDQRLMFRVLQSIKFYDTDLIRAKLKEAHGIVTRGTSWTKDKLKRSDILVSYLDAPGKSGAHYARLYADENSIYVDQVVDQGKLEKRIRTGGIKILVFIDDFLGSGGSVSENLKGFMQNHKAYFKGSDTIIYFVAMCGFTSATARIDSVVNSFEIPVRVHVCDLLTDADVCFSEDSNTFREVVDRDRARNLAYEKGVQLAKKTPLGYGDCQASVVFDSSCPNNTLPILWASSKSWMPLFPRL